MIPFARLVPLVSVAPCVLWGACAAAPARLPCNSISDCDTDEVCREGECAVFFAPAPFVPEEVPLLAARGAVLVTSEDVPLTITLDATGGDGTDIAWRVFNESQHLGFFQVDDENDTLSFDPLADVSGLASASVTPVQSGVFGQPAQILVDVGAIDDGPRLTINGPFVTQVDTTLTIGVSATDRENEAIGFAATFENGTASVSSVDDGVASINYVPAAGFVGNDEGDVTATDATDASTSLKVIVTVE